MSDPIDNSALVAGFVPETDDGDAFIYTELLDRSKRTGGSNRVRVLRTFFHRSRDDFWRRWPTIKQMCDQTNIRAYTRLAPRSFAKVGKLFARNVVEKALEGNWDGMRYLYASACGSVAPEHKVWLWDVDLPVPGVEEFSDYLNASNLLLARVPSRKGFHLVTPGFDIRSTFIPLGVSLHKDNPTNLYIPGGAA